MSADEPLLPAAGQGEDGCDRIARWFVMVVAAGLVWRLARFGLHFELTGDEANILRSVMERSYAGLLDPLSYNNVSPPMFLWMTKFIDGVFQNDWAARLAPFLAGIGAVAMFGLICREALRGTARWVAWAVFCVSYVPIAEGTRVKSYAIDLLAATVVLWLMLRWALGGRQARHLVWLALCAPLFVWLSYTSVFVIGAAGFFWAVCLIKTRLISKEALDHSERWGWRNIAAGLAFAAASVVSAIFLYKINIRPGLDASLSNGLADAWKRGYPPLDQPWKIPLWLLTVHTGRGFAWPIGENHFGSTLTFLLWLTGLAVCWRRGNRWVWALLVTPQVLALAAAFLHKYPYLQNPRLCMFLGPGICLFAGAGVAFLIDKLGGEKRRRCYCLAAGALMLCACGGLGRDVAMRVREFRGPGIRGTLMEASRRVGADGQFVLLNDAGASGVSSYYLQREIKQKVWQNGQVPTPMAPGLRLALVVVSSKTSGTNDNLLFGEFEKRLGRPVKTRWSQVAHQVLLDSKDSVAVRVCEREN